jgi:hypothetical protein
MKVNFDSKLCNIDGTTITSNNEDLLLKKVSIEALMMLSDSDRGSSGEVKFKRYELALKISVGGEVEISPEEAATLKARIGEVYGPAVIGPAWKLLNG